MAPDRPDLSLLGDVVAPRILEAVEASARFLRERGIEHLLVGGLAIGAHGHPRATKDVDFLVSDNAFHHHGGGIVTMLGPVQVNGVAVDYLSVGADEPFLRELLQAPVHDSVPVIPLEGLIYLKLKAGRAQDVADVVALVNSGIDVQRCRVWLAKNAPRLVPKLDQVEQQARRER